MNLIENFALVRLLAVLCFFTCPAAYSQTNRPAIAEDDLTFFDTTRSRPVPVAVYQPLSQKGHPKLVIFSHGYDANKGGSNKQYKYLAQRLASEGYVVASIQHELNTDSLLPATGIPQVVRRTNWERGVVNILFVLNELKKTRPELDYRHVTLIGHSNGGDMSMLFAQKYPGLIHKVISLDNRRVALPRTKRPRVYTLRSSDQPADEGVLPTAEEQKRYHITIIKLPNTIHNDMDDDGTPAQKEEINRYILQFLKE